MTVPVGDAASRARRRRAFIAAHHPDRGGDPAVFIAGLAAFDHAATAHTAPLAPSAPSASPRTAASRVVVTIAPHRARWTRIVAAAGSRFTRHSRPPRVR